MMKDNFRLLRKETGSSSFGVVRQIRCDFQDCSQSAILRLDRQRYCLDHLVAHCLERLEACQQQICRYAAPADDTVTSNDYFLEECTSKIAGFLIGRPGLQNIDRARLLDVLLWAAELDAKYDRSAVKCRAAAGAA
jgi:hypothetical protein